MPFTSGQRIAGEAPGLEQLLAAGLGRAMPVGGSGAGGSMDAKSGLVSVGRGLVNAVPTHHAALGPLMDMVSGRGLSLRDETGSVNVGPQGIALQRVDEKGRPDWSLRVNPDGRGGAVGLGDLEIGGSFQSGDQRAYVRKGALQVEGGYGYGGAEGMPGGSEKPAGWANLSFQVGQPADKPSDEMAEMMGRGAAAQAVAPFVEPEPQAAFEPSARQLADDLIRGVKGQRGGVNPLYW